MKWKSFFKYNIPAAVVCFVLIVLLSTVLGVNRSVGAIASDVKKTYTKSLAYTDVKKYLGNAKDIYAMYSSINSQEGFPNSTDAYYAQALQNLEQSMDSPFGISDCMNEIYEYSYEAYEYIQESDCEEDIKDSCVKYFYDLKENLARLKQNDEYNTAAQKLNTATQKWLARLLYFGKKEAVIFS